MWCEFDSNHPPTCEPNRGNWVPLSANGCQMSSVGNNFPAFESPRRLLGDSNCAQSLPIVTNACRLNATACIFVGDCTPPHDPERVEYQSPGSRSAPWVKQTQTHCYQPRRGCRNVGHPASTTLSGLAESFFALVDPGCASRPWAVIFDPFGVVC